MISCLADYKEKLLLFHSLLNRLNENKWAKYFSTSIYLLEKNKPHKSMRHFLAAFGGMGSYNDSQLLTGASEAENKQLEEMSSDLYQYCRANYSWFRGLFE